MHCTPPRADGIAPPGTPPTPDAGRRSLLQAGAAAPLLAGASLPALAQSAKDYPNRPIHVIVPSPAGGPPDLIIRMLGPTLNEELGQPIVPENRAGAGGIVGSNYVAKAAPDGYTVLFTTASHTNIPPFNPNVPYDPVKDFTPVTLAAQNFGQALIINPSVPARNVQELIALAKKQPGKLTYASAGIGTASHIPAEIMKSMTDTDILGVQYKGVAQAMTDLMGGHVDMFFVGTQIALSAVEKGSVRALAVTGLKRWPGMPDVPTLDESGLKGFNLINWFGMWLPAGAPPEIVARLQKAMVKALSTPEVKKQFDTLGLEPVGMPSAEFGRFVEKESRTTNEIARRIAAAEKK